MTIERLEWLEKWATPGPWVTTDTACVRSIEKGCHIAYVHPHDDVEFVAVSRNALPALLKIARAAETLAHDGCKCRYGQNAQICDACGKLQAALAELEAL